MPRHKKKKRATTAVGDAKRTDWLVGDLVVAKLRGHRPWPAQIQKPEDYGYDARPHRIFVTFFGTQETCFCSYNKITPFTTAVRKSLAEQLQKINTNPELEKAIKEIFAADDELQVSGKSHGGCDKEDDLRSDKSVEENLPIEQTRKRARVGEVALTYANVVEDKPAEQDRVVKSVTSEQVQKLPRKVRIKVSTRRSDAANHQGDGGALTGSDKAGDSSSQSGSTEVSSQPGRREVATRVAIAVENFDDPTAIKVDHFSRHGSLVTSKENGDSTVVKANESGPYSEDYGEVIEKMEVDESTRKETSTTKSCDDGVAKVKVDDGSTKLVRENYEGAAQMVVDDDSAGKETVASKPDDDGVEKMKVCGSLTTSVSEDDGEATEKMELDNSTRKETVTPKLGDDGTEKMKVGDWPTESVTSKTSVPSLAIGMDSIKGDDPTGKVEDSVRHKCTSVQQVNESTTSNENDPTGKVEGSMRHHSTSERELSERTAVKGDDDLCGTVEDSIRRKSTNGQQANESKYGPAGKLEGSMRHHCLNEQDLSDRTTVKEDTRAAEELERSSGQEPVSRRTKEDEEVDRLAEQCTQRVTGPEVGAEVGQKQGEGGGKEQVLATSTKQDDVDEAKDPVSSVVRAAKEVEDMSKVEHVRVHEEQLSVPIKRESVSSPE